MMDTNIIIKQITTGNLNVDITLNVATETADIVIRKNNLVVLEQKDLKAKEVDELSQVLEEIYREIKSLEKIKNKEK